jgi:hypothetical protein
MTTKNIGFSAASLVLLAISLFTAPASHALDANGQRFGKDLIGEFVLPPEQIAKFAKFKPSAPVPGESVLINALAADAEVWAGPSLDVMTASSPYNISIIVSGTAIISGDVASLWQAGWGIEDGNGSSQERMTPLGGIAKDDVKAGQRVSLVAAQGPVTFREDRKATLMVGLVNARNLKIEEVKVQLWSGAAATPKRTFLFVFGAALVGLVMLGFVWWSRRDDL